jgi:hypothetical protein
MRKPKSLSEVERELKEAGFKYLGGCSECDCYTNYWVKPIGEGRYIVAIADGWFDDYTPRFKEVNEEEMQRIKKWVLGR